MPWNISILFLCFMSGAVAAVLSRLWHGRRRLAYRLQAAGALVSQAGMIAFVVGLGIRGEWGWFWYVVFVYGLLTLLAASGAFDLDSRTRSRQHSEQG